MELLEKSIFINAPKEKVFDILINDSTYREWTSAFCEGSYYEIESWEVWQKIVFKSNTPGWLISKVSHFDKPNQLWFSHQGWINSDGWEDYNSPNVLPWKNSREIYTLSDVDGGTKLDILQDIPDHEECWSFWEMWDRALEKVKEIAQR